jgi:cytochrome P450
VRIVACAYCLHRNEEIFPQRKRWLPERWLDSTEKELFAMNKLFWGFGSGSRQCLGRNVAMELLRFAIAAVYTNFETVAVDETMFNDQMFITGSLEEKLLLSVKHVV